jgi:hypothetical protein
MQSSVSDDPPPSASEVLTAREMTLALLQARSQTPTVCPSEVARALMALHGATRDGWRQAMPTVHAAIDELVGDGLVRLSWKGERLPRRAGPYRIASGRS